MNNLQPNNTTATQGSNHHIISLLVNNKPGVLIRIALVFSRRGYNIDNLVTHPTHHPQYSMITIGASGDERSLRLILKQLHKLVDVIDAQDRSNDSVVTQELALIKCNFQKDIRSELLHLATSFNCTILDMTEKSVIFSCTGDSVKLNSLEDIFKSFGIIEIIRTGTLLMIRGESPTA